MNLRPKSYYLDILHLITLLGVMVFILHNEFLYSNFEMWASLPTVYTSLHIYHMEKYAGSKLKNFIMPEQDGIHVMKRYLVIRKHKRVSNHGVSCFWFIKMVVKDVF